MGGFLALLTVLLATISTSSAHLFFTYPGTRGNNLHDDFGNTTKCERGTSDDYDGGRGCFPYGMQWMYPCGGLAPSGLKNRTYWPTTGGGVAFQPGWFQGHSTAFIYVNIGLGTRPLNMSHPMVPPFQIVGPTNDPYPYKDVCLPQVGMPANISFHDGMNATIQIVEAAKHGAALYSCVDVILTTNHSQVAKLTPDNCKNSSDIGFELVYASIPLKDNSGMALSRPNLLGITALSAAVMAATFLI